MYPEQVINYIADDYSQEDELFVKKWVAESPEREQEVKNLKKLWKATSELKFKSDVDRVWSQVALQMGEEVTWTKEPDIGKPRVRKRTRNVMETVIRAAAVLLIAVGVWGFYQFTNPTVQKQQQKHVYQTISSKEGQQTHYRFNDGSKVVLNSGSQLRFRSNFGEGTRRLELEGEAYFEVNHDHELPFVVVTKNIRIKDIGTKFNINSYPGTDRVEVVVAGGVVEVSDFKRDSSESSVFPSRSVVLSQGEKVEITAHTSEFVIERADLHKTLSWVNNHLVFDRERLEEVVKQLERHYDISIEVQAKELLKKRITASFQDETIENVLKVLSLSLGAKYNINNQKVTIYKNQ